MHLGYRTIESLYHLSRVSRTIHIRTSGEAIAFDRQIGLRACADLPDRFPRDVTFVDVEAFLTAFTQLGPNNVDVRFEANGCTLISNGVEAFVATADVSELRTEPPLAGIGSGAVANGFVLDNSAPVIWQKVLSRAGARDRFDALLSSDGSKVALTLHRTSLDDRLGGLASFRQSLGLSSEKFTFRLAAGALLPLPSDRYTASVSTGSPPELILTATTRPLRYAVTLKVSTVETKKTDTP